MAPEIILQRPGTDACLCYGKTGSLLLYGSFPPSREGLPVTRPPWPGKSDEWAAGTVVHELLSTALLGPNGFEPHRPFADFDRPETFTDAGYQDTDRPGTLQSLRSTVRELLRLEPADRLSALDASHRFEAAVSEAHAAEAAATAAAEAARLEAEAEAIARAAQEAELVAARVRRRERAAAAAAAAEQEANRAAAVARAEAEAARVLEAEATRLAAEEEAEAQMQIAEADTAMRARRR